MFPLQIAGMRPIKDDMGRLICRAWSGAATALNIVSSFRLTGVFPPSLDVVLSNIIGAKPLLLDTSLAAFIQPLEISERAARRL